jgi:hypothetical protein
MKKIVILLIMILSLTGCVRQSPCRVVTSIQVTSASRQYRYDSPDKLRKFTLYLRTLETWGPASLDELEGAEYRILLTYSDGGSKLYRIRNDRCLSINNQDWKKIRPEYGSALPLFLSAIPSDQVP